MNSKIVLAFAAGALIASGVVYVAVKPEPAARRPAASEAAAKPASKPAAVAAPSPAPAAMPGPAPAPILAEPAEGPAPVRRAVRREKPARIAQWQPVRRPPIIDAKPERIPDAKPEPIYKDPINKERPINDSQPEPADTHTGQPAPAAPAPQPAPEPALNATPATPSATPSGPPREAHTVTIPAGTLLTVRMGETVSAQRNQTGDEFLATLDQPLIVEGFVIAERGSRAQGRVVSADASGRVRGVSELRLELVRLATSDGQHIRLNTQSFVKQAAPSRGADAAKIGAGAAIGAAIGGIAGGGKGAGIGAGVGGAAGAADVLLTRGKAELPVETRVSFRLNQAVTITERVN